MCLGGISRGSQAPQEDRAEVAKAPEDQDNFSEKEIQAILDHVLSGRQVYRLSLQSRRCSARLWVGAWVNQRELDNRQAPRATSSRYPEQCGARPAAGCRSARLQRAPEARGLDKHSNISNSPWRRCQHHRLQVIGCGVHLLFVRDRRSCLRTVRS